MQPENSIQKALLPADPALATNCTISTSFGTTSLPALVFGRLDLLCLLQLRLLASSFLWLDSHCQVFTFAARGLDIPGIRTVIHYQLPHSADVYIHRSGRTTRASSHGCSIALISPKDKAKFISLCKSMKKETLRQFPLEESYLPIVMKRMSLACQLDKISRKNTQENVKKNWLKWSAESLELTLEESGSEEETVTAYKQKRAKSVQLKNLQQELNFLLAQPLRPRTFSRRYLLGAGISFDLQKQLEQLSNIKEAEKMNPKEKLKPNFAVFGQQCIEPLQALRNSGHEVSLRGDNTRESRRAFETLKRKRKEEKKKMRDERRKKRKQMKEARLNNM